MFSQPTSNRTDDENGPVKSRLGISVGGKIAIIVSIFVIGAIFCGGLFLRKRQKEDDNGDETSMGCTFRSCDAGDDQCCRIKRVIQGVFASCALSTPKESPMDLEDQKPTIQKERQDSINLSGSLILQKSSKMNTNVA
ncbi:uncharacterized protein LOC135155633 isoform X2 [Lytechinus pictus]|uniref:uncharacterized protein LOC135155633 isoform X2 n=1 Tax=Lytechinus pictus TaxID=7653 RepID=UPI0030B9BCA6